MQFLILSFFSLNLGIPIHDETGAEIGAATGIVSGLAATRFKGMGWKGMVAGAVVAGAAGAGLGNIFDKHHETKQNSTLSV
jgi:hypothetical protein